MLNLFDFFLRPSSKQEEKEKWNKGESAAVSNELGASEIRRCYCIQDLWDFPLPFSPWGQIGPQLWTIGTMSALGSMREKISLPKEKKILGCLLLLSIRRFFFGGSRVGVYQGKGRKIYFSYKNRDKKLVTIFYREETGNSKKKDTLSVVVP